jgi:hypothetical protein
VTRIAEDVAGLSQLLALLAEHGNGAPAALTSLSRPTRGCWSLRWWQPGSPCSRSIPGPRLATASATRKRRVNPR